jgi:hypothetical protein
MSVVPAEVNYQDFDLHEAQSKNDRLLKSRFECIFQKYERDFTGVGDEVDLATGEILVDNGHISTMRDEQDVGEAVQNTQMSGRSLLRALTVAPEGQHDQNQILEAQRNGRSLLRALTVAPDGQDVPHDTIEVDHEDDSFDEDGDNQVYDRDGWTSIGSEQEYESTAGVDDDLPMDDNEMGDDLSDSDDSILGPKKTRRPVRSLSTFEQGQYDHATAGPAVPGYYRSLGEHRPTAPLNKSQDWNKDYKLNQTDHWNSGHRLHGFGSNPPPPNPQRLSLPSHSDTIWNAPPLGNDGEFRPRTNETGRLRSAGYRSPKRSLWAPIPTKPRMKNTDRRSNKTQSHGRQKTTEGNSHVVDLSSDDSDDPLQDDTITTSTALRNSRTISNSQHRISPRNGEATNQRALFVEISETVNTHNSSDLARTAFASASMKNEPSGISSDTLSGRSKDQSKRDYHVEPGPYVASHLIIGNGRSLTEHEVQEQDSQKNGRQAQKRQKNRHEDQEYSSKDNNKKKLSEEGLRQTLLARERPRSEFGKAAADHCEKATGQSQEWNFVARPEFSKRDGQSKVTDLSDKRPNSRARPEFSQREDDLLIRLKEVEGLRWQMIRQCFPQYGQYQIQYRYYKVLQHRYNKKIQGKTDQRRTTFTGADFSSYRDGSVDMRLQPAERNNANRRSDTRARQSPSVNHVPYEVMETTSVDTCTPRPLTPALNSALEPFLDSGKIAEGSKNRHITGRAMVGGKNTEDTGNKKEVGTAHELAVGPAEREKVGPDNWEESDSDYLPDFSDLSPAKENIDREFRERQNLSLQRAPAEPPKRRSGRPFKTEPSPQGNPKNLPKPSKTPQAKSRDRYGIGTESLKRRSRRPRKSI